MNNYHFNPNRKMSSGYCSIIVKKVDRAQHQGQWTCVSKLTGSDSESSDEFRVTVFDTISVASVSGMMFFAIFLMGGLAFITYRGYRRKYSPRRTTRQTVVTYVTNSGAVSIQSETQSNVSQFSSESQSNSSQFDGVELQAIRLNWGKNVFDDAYNFDKFFILIL